MRHNYKGRKLGTDFSHTKAMKKSLVNALFLNDRIKTVESRAKEIRPNVDKIITWAKKGDLHSRRLAIAALGDKELVREIFEKVAQGMFQDRQGGYTRIMKLGNRKGDNAPMVIMELVIEMLCRGIRLAPVDLYQSDATQFLLVSDTLIRMPFNALPGLGEAAAQSIVEAREAAPFISVEDLRNRTKISQALIELLREGGCLSGLPETNQTTLFSL